MKKMDRIAYVDKYRETVLAIATIIFAIAFAIDIINQPTGMEQTILSAIMVITWAIFSIDYFYQLLHAKQKKKWLLRHIPELLMVILPPLRTLRLLRLLSLAVVFHKYSGNHLRHKLISYIIGSTIILVFASSLAILDLERDAPDTGVHDFADALWWSLTTITTVGYGDISPVTDLGRITAVFLMICGIGLLGIVTATFASWIVEQVGEESQKQEDEQTRVLNELKIELAEVKALLEDKKTKDSSDNPTSS